MHDLVALVKLEDSLAEVLLPKLLLTLAGAQMWILGETQSLSYPDYCVKSHRVVIAAVVVSSQAHHRTAFSRDGRVKRWLKGDAHPHARLAGVAHVSARAEDKRDEASHPP